MKQFVRVYLYTLIILTAPYAAAFKPEESKVKESGKIPATLSIALPPEYYFHPTREEIEKDQQYVSLGYDLKPKSGAVVSYSKNNKGYLPKDKEEFKEGINKLLTPSLKKHISESGGAESIKEISFYRSPLPPAYDIILKNQIDTLSALSLVNSKKADTEISCCLEINRATEKFKAPLCPGEPCKVRYDYCDTCSSAIGFSLSQKSTSRTIFHHDNQAELLKKAADKNRTEAKHRLGYQDMERVADIFVSQLRRLASDKKGSASDSEIVANLYFSKHCSLNQARCLAYFKARAEEVEGVMVKTSSYGE